MTAVAAVALCLAAGPGPRVEYNRDVRPILAENCFACHGPDSAARKANLRLDQRDAALKKEAFVPGKPADSELVSRITSADADEVMPPPGSHKKLTPTQKDLLTRWVAQGAEYQPHWSLIAPTRPPLPVVKNAGWVRNPIDRFVLARLEAEGLTPAPEADRRTLARRLALDLTGLPPSPAEVEEFVNDKAADAYERYVERMMRSPHWGEHRGRYWLDAARYADTHGIHFDNFREMWSYRDWVINAFNKNQRFDQFTVEQLAGDLLPNATLEQKIATGFNRCNITTNEGGVIGEEYLVLYTRDRTETTAQVWLGLTAGCAVCHDHKFDPLSQKEFYSLAAFFNNTTQAAMDGNIRDTPPILPVPPPDLAPRFAAVTADVARLTAQLEDRKKGVRPEFDRWLADPKADHAAGTLPETGLAFHAPLNEGSGDVVTVSLSGKPKRLPMPGGVGWDKGKLGAKAFRPQAGPAVEVPEVGDFEKDRGFTAAAWLRLTKNNQTGAVVARMDEGNGHRGWDVWVEGNRIGAHVIHEWPKDALKVLTKRPFKANEWNHVVVSYDGSGKAAGLRVYVNGQPQETDVLADSLKNSIRATVPLKLAQRHNSSKLDALVLEDLRLYDRGLPAAEAARLAAGTRAAALATRPAAKLTPAEKNELFEWWLSARDGPSRALADRLATLRQEETALRSRGTVAHVMNEKSSPPMAYVLFRGEYDKRRDPVKAEIPKALPPMPADLPRDRLGFAHWLLRPENPLTARVTVNRFWQEVFGTGLVRTAGDFGVTGEQPSHPELLDWLAVEFREGGWDVKQFFKLLVTSAAYRQSAAATPAKLEKDRDNRLLSRGPRFRMDAEMIRDHALAASGLLVRKTGGPSVKPYQPEGVWEAVAMIGSNTRDYKRDTGESLYRRGLYTFWKRSAPPASLDILNAPNRETCAVRRERTNTPLQALVTLNDPTFVEAARHLAQAALKEGGATDDARLDFVARRLLARPFTPAELAVVKESLSGLVTHYGAKPDDAAKLIAVGESKADAAIAPPTLAAWTMLANELMNLDEVLCK
jgi:hypothetical protein